MAESSKDIDRLFFQVSTCEHRYWLMAELGETLFSHHYLCTIPVEVPLFGTPIIVGSFIYHIGGMYTPRLYPIETPSTKVFLFDTLNPDKGWMEGTSMIVGRDSPSAIFMDEKIFVFGGFFGNGLNTNCCFGEVFDLKSNTWEPLPNPPLEHVESTIIPIDLHNYSHRIIPICLGCMDYLFGFHIDSRSWISLSHTKSFTGSFDGLENALLLKDDRLYCHPYGSGKILQYEFYSNDFRVKSIWFDEPFPDPMVFNISDDRYWDLESLIALKNDSMCLVRLPKRTCFDKIMLQKFKICGKSQGSGVIDFADSIHVGQGHSVEYVLSL